MRIFTKSGFSSLIFLWVFIAPHTIYSIIPKNSISLFYLIMLSCYIVCGFFIFRDLLNVKYKKPFMFTASFLIFGIINLFIHQSFHMLNLILPVMAYFGFIFINKINFKASVFDYFIIFLYIYFSIIYFSILPDFFYRPGFDEDAMVFDNASSNAIPIGLNITLYAYLILNRLTKASNQKKIIFFALINFALIIIQQSRIGILISLIILFLAIFEFRREKIAKVVFAILCLLTFFTIFSYSVKIRQYTNLIGNININSALVEDVRGDAQATFFKNIDTYTVIFGHPDMVYSGYGENQILYTFNTFLDMWNKYGISLLFIFAFFLIYRFLNWKKFEFPLYYFLPFIVYSLVESIFFPNFWDTIIYLLLFAPKRIGYSIINKQLGDLGKSNIDIAQYKTAIIV